MDSRIESILIELRAGLEAIYGGRLKAVILYGSHARGEAKPGWDSDVDVAFLLDEFADPSDEIERTGDLVAELSLRHGLTIALFPLTYERWQRGDTPLLSNIRREGIAAR